MIWLLAALLLFPLAANAATTDGVAPLVEDTFTDGDGTSITGHTPDTDTPGNGWAIEPVWDGASAGTAEIQNAKLELAAQTGAMIDLGQANMVCEADYTSPVGEDSRIAIVLRYTDESNWVQAQFLEALGTIRLQVRVNDVDTNYGSQSYTSTEGQTYKLRAWGIGTSFGMSIDGTTVATATITEHAAATKCGLAANANTAASPFDNFKAWPGFAPEVDSIVIAGSTLTLSTSEALSVGSGGSGGLSLSCSGGAVTPSFDSGGGTTALTWTLSRSIGDETCTADYTQPGDGLEATTGGVDLPSFADFDVFTGSTVLYESCTVGGSTIWYADGECPASVGPVNVILDGSDLEASATVDRGDCTLGWYVSQSATPPACDVIIDGSGSPDFHATTTVNSVGQLWQKTATGLTGGTDVYVHATCQRAKRPDCDIETSEMVSIPGSPPAEGEIKWNPGHYMIAPNGSSLSTRLDFFDEIENEDDLKGIQVRYFWRELETSFDEYNFADLDTLLNKASEVGKQLTLEIWTRDFGTSKKVSPAYIQSSEYGGGDFSAYNDGTRFVTRYWDEPTMDRLGDLVVALGNRYNDHPNFELIRVLPESAMGPQASSASGYSPSAASANFLDVLGRAKTAWSNTIVTLGANFWPSDSQMITWFEQGDTEGYGMGGPDVGCKSPVTAHGVLQGSLGGVDYRGRIPISWSVERDQNFCTPAENYALGNGEVQNTHMAWMRNTWTSNPDHNWFDDTLPFIQSIDGALDNTDCPSTISCAP